MKIVQINTTLHSGSTGRITTQLHAMLLQRGDTGTIAFGYGDKNDPDGFSMYSYFGTHWHSFWSRKLCLQGRLSILQTRRLVKHLEFEEPELIHLHNIHGHYLNYPMLFRYLKKSETPVLWTFHDCWPFTGKCAHYFSATCDRWKTSCFDCPNLEAYPNCEWDGSTQNFRLKKKLFTSIENLHIVCNSKWLETQVRQSFLGDKCIHQIYNGIDPAIFCPRPDLIDAVKLKYGIPNDRFVVLGVSGVWKKDKGLDTFLEVAKHLPSSHVAVLVGLNATQMSNLPENIIGIEHTENVQELAALYSSADVLLNPSQEETFGMVPVEAMACGTPAIVANTTGCSETVADGVTGFVVDMKDVPSILVAIEKVSMMGKGAFSVACINRVGECFTQVEMLQKYYDLYKKLCTMK